MVNEDKLREILDMFEYEELARLREELDGNVSFLKTEIEQRLQEIENSENNVCVTCGRRINPSRKDYFQLVFGPAELKKKAHFCAADCLEYFVRKLRELDMKVERGVIADRDDLEKEFESIDFDEFDGADTV